MSIFNCLTLFILIFDISFMSHIIIHGCGLCFGVAILSPLYYPRMWVINFMLIMLRGSFAHVDTNLLPTYFQLDTSLDTSLDTPLDTPLYVDMWICEYVNTLVMLIRYNMKIRH
uniref:Orf113 n=1 Tax=Picobiliphyte sp. MS584-11 TaxID=1157699 RepID=A0A2H4R8C6_9EUKA|nr:orf113 [Picobiliphyte sp. MS584-11]